MERVAQERMFGKDDFFGDDFQAEDKTAPGEGETTPEAGPEDAAASVETAAPDEEPAGETALAGSGGSGGRRRSLTWVQSTVAVIFLEVTSKERLS